ncbi:MAG TPA: YafY family protein [Duganella sp.]|uniref:helix-turn-helix transcriptional regulator n=1 Tax=Duganella sp. TaxID=1904440 RepID=UPI002ED62B29
MSRSHRLFDILQVLRRHRGTVSGKTLAQEAGVSLRTIRRDIVTLQAMGAEIDGEPGVGYILRPGFLLPPLSFSEDELQAIVAGAQWVSLQTDDVLALAAQNALAKIGGVLPADRRGTLEDNALYIGRQKEAASIFDLAAVRLAIREQRKMRLMYQDQLGAASERVIWPIMLGFVQSRRFIAGWCELRGDFRLFRVDRIVHADFLQERYAQDRRLLVKQWRAKEFIKSRKA